MPARRKLAKKDVGVRHKPAQRRRYSNQPGGRITTSNPAGFRTIVARHPGTCRRCGGAVVVGTPVRWAPKRGTYHMADQCGIAAETELETELAAAAAGETTYTDPVTGAAKAVRVTPDGLIIPAHYDESEVF